MRKALFMKTYFIVKLFILQWSALWLQSRFQSNFISGSQIPLIFSFQKYFTILFSLAKKNKTISHSKRIATSSDIKFDHRVNSILQFLPPKSSFHPSFAPPPLLSATVIEVDLEYISRHNWAIFCQIVDSAKKSFLSLKILISKPLFSSLTAPQPTSNTEWGKKVFIWPQSYNRATMYGSGALFLAFFRGVSPLVSVWTTATGV